MADSTRPALNLTPEEKRVYGQLFQQADSDGLGVVTGDVAVKFFERTQLDSTVLGEIWQIADAENRGLLTPAGFSIVLRLIGHCQAGSSASLELATRPGPLPRFDPLPTQAQQPIIASPALSTGPIRVPPLSPDKVTEYSLLFEKAGARSGLLGGDAAKQVFEKARLPNEVLGQIWTLADREERGALNSREFIVAMHLLASMRSGAMRALPQSLPQALYEAATPRQATSVIAAAIPRQLSGQPGQRAQSPLTRPAVGPAPLSAQSTGNDWLIPPQDKLKFDQSFASIDRAGRGFITGDQAVGFFSNSGLSEEMLASIWDLADIDSENEGQLNRDEFAVAMYLIRQQRSKKDDRGILPSTLPARLVPPTLRHRSMPASSQPSAPTFDNAAFATQPTQQSKSAADDLFGLDAFSSDVSAQQPASPQVKALDPSQTGSPRSPTSFQPPSRAPGSAFKPFLPTSSFGQGLAVQNTGESVQSNQSQSRTLLQNQATIDRDLLGDTDPEISKKLTQETTELANMSNQVGTLKTQMQEVQNKKSSKERELAASSNQRKDLEIRLAQFRAQYEQEVRDVKLLEERLNISRNETHKLEQELAMVEGAHQDLKAQHQQIGVSLETDQRENVSLKEKIANSNSEVAHMKSQLEKMRADARQQKGMVAINKKQLATNEGEKTKVNEEIESVQRSFDERPAASRSLSGEPSSVVASPSSVHSMNPFFRALSPQATAQTNAPSSGVAQRSATFDDVFGPSQSAREAASSPTTSEFENNRPVQTASTVESTQTITPPTSPPLLPGQETPQAFVPPPPPTSRQMTSSALPFPSNLAGAQSANSSVRAHPPASRGGVSGDATPTQSITSLTDSADRDANLANGDNVHSATATSLASQPAHSTTIAADMSRRELHRSPTVERPISHINAVPGAFPGEIESPSTSSVAGGESSSASRGDLFEQHTERSHAVASSANSDFESAFSSTGMNGTSHAVEGQDDGTNGFPGSKTRSEFPPIKDVEPDESESGSEAGFENDFVDLEPSHEHSNELPTPTIQSISHTTATKEEELPSLSAQKSPPTYDQAQPSISGEHRDANQFPPEFGGLLPAREVSNSSPDAVQSPGSFNTSTAARLQAISSESESTSRVATSGMQAPGQPKLVVPDEFDSAFDDLDEAQEADPQAHDGFGAPPEHRGDDDFNPVFSSPTPSRFSAVDKQQTPTGVTSHNIAGSSVFASSSDSPFGTVQEAQPVAEASSHDWDAIFSGLDRTPEVSQDKGKDPFALDEPASQPSNTTGPSSTSLQRPANTLNRAISVGTEHDDPILKSLTSMGYPRDESLKALEKYDYNLDKAADYLTSKHN